MESEAVQKLKAIVGEEYISTRNDVLLTYSVSASTSYEAVLPGAVVRPADTRQVSEILTTACPFCEYNLKEGAESTGSKIKVVDILDLIAQCLQ